MMKKRIQASSTPSTPLIHCQQTQVRENKRKALSINNKKDNVSKKKNKDRTKLDLDIIDPFDECDNNNSYTLNTTNTNNEHHNKGEIRHDIITNNDMKSIELELNTASMITNNAKTNTIHIPIESTNERFKREVDCEAKPIAVFSIMKHRKRCYITVEDSVVYNIWDYLTIAELFKVCTRIHSTWNYKINPFHTINQSFRINISIDDVTHLKPKYLLTRKQINLVALPNDALAISTLIDYLSNLTSITLTAKHTDQRFYFIANINTLIQQNSNQLLYLNITGNIINRITFTTIANCIKLQTLILRNANYSDLVDMFNDFHSYFHLACEAYELFDDYGNVTLYIHKTKEYRQREREIQAEKAQHLQEAESNMIKGFSNMFKDKEKLTELSLRNSAIQANQLKIISQLALSITSLDIGNNILTSESLHYIHHFNELKQLKLDKCDISLALLNDIIHYLPTTIQDLDLNSNNSLPNQGFYQLFTSTKITSLQKLNISHNNQIINANMFTSNVVGSLISLNLFGCNQIDDIAINIISKLKHLQYLNAHLTRHKKVMNTNSNAAVTTIQSLHSSITSLGCSYLSKMNNLLSLILTVSPTVKRDGLLQLANSKTLKLIHLFANIDLNNIVDSDTISLHQSKLTTSDCVQFRKRNPKIKLIIHDNTQLIDCWKYSHKFGEEELVLP